MSESYSVTCAVLIVALFLVALIALGITIEKTGNYVACRALEGDIDLNVKFRLINGCFVEVEEGIWVPRDTYGVYLLNKMEE